jgi:hypothetical protein
LSFEQQQLLRLVFTRAGSHEIRQVEHKAPGVFTLHIFVLHESPAQACAAGYTAASRLEAARFLVTLGEGADDAPKGVTGREV